MSLIPAIKRGNDEKPSAAGAEGRLFTRASVETIRSTSCCSDVMDDLILLSYCRQLILPLHLQHFCLIMLLPARLSPAFAYLI